MFGHKTPLVWHRNELMAKWLVKTFKYMNVFLENWLYFKMQDPSANHKNYSTWQFGQPLYGCKLISTPEK
jgi:hypothetical protein